MPVTLNIQSSGQQVSLSTTVMDFVSSGVASFTDSSGRDHIIFFPSNFNKDPLVPGLHYIKEGDQFVLLNQSLDGLGNARDIELVKDQFGFVDSFFVADHGLEYSDRPWPLGYIYKYSVLDDGNLARQQVSEFAAFNHSIATSDINQDGVLDLIVQNMGQNNPPEHSVNEALNGYISAGNTYQNMDLDFDSRGGVSWGGGAVLFEDLNIDGVDELIQFNYGKPDIVDWEWGGFRVFNVNQSGSLSYLQSASRSGAFETMGVSGVSSVDLDSDGDLDLVASLEGAHPDLPSQQWSGQAIQVFRNTDGNLNVAYELLMKTDQYHMREAEILDVNFDGAIDIVRQTTAPQLANIFLLNTDDFSFNPNTPSLESTLFGEHMFSRVAQFNNSGPTLVSFYRQGDHVYPVVFESIAQEAVEINTRSFEGRVFGSLYDDHFFARTENFEVFGNEGIDHQYFESLASEFILTKAPGDISSPYHISSTQYDALLIQIERIVFSDVNIALDLHGSAGQTAKTLAAVIGEEGLSNKEYVGIGLQLFDAGQSLASVCELALTAVGATTHADVVYLLYTNLFGETPTEAQAEEYISALDAGVFTKGSLAAAAAELTDDLGVIDLVGLAETGIEYI